MIFGTIKDIFRNELRRQKLGIYEDTADIGKNHGRQIENKIENYNEWGDMRRIRRLQPNERLKDYELPLKRTMFTTNVIIKINQV